MRLLLSLDPEKNSWRVCDADWGQIASGLSEIRVRVPSTLSMLRRGVSLSGWLVCDGTLDVKDGKGEVNAA